MATKKSQQPAVTPELAGIKQIILFIFKSKDNFTGYLSDGKINFFEGIGIAAMATEATALVKELLPTLPKKVTAANINEITLYVVNEFELTKNKELEAQIKKSITWIQATKEFIDGWKTIK